MPQKRNPDVFELIRGRSATAQACLTEALAVCAKLPSGYQRDLQLLKFPLFRGIDLPRATLAILPPAIAALEFRPAAIRLDPAIHAAERSQPPGGRGGHPVPRGVPARRRKAEELEAAAAATRSARLRPGGALRQAVAILRGIFMTKVLGISGSLRRGSYNSALLRAATGSCPRARRSRWPASAASRSTTATSRPRGSRRAVSQLKEAVVAADGVLLVTPEYNNSIPGVFKNTIDWLSRPPADARRVFGGRRFAIIGASPGAFGTILSQSGWLPVLRTLGVQLWTGGRLDGVARQ